MPLEQISGMITQLLTLVFAGYTEQMISLALYTLGIVIYGIVVWNYYRHLAKRDIFKIDLSKYRPDEKFVWLKKIVDVFFYLIRYMIIFPLFTFLWFGILSFFLFFLAKSQTPQGILLSAITIVSAVRFTAYYSEDLSKDLAKMIPFALLGIFIVDPSFLSLTLVMERFQLIPTFLDLILRYLLFVVLLEFGLRTLYGFAMLIGIRKKPQLPKEIDRSVVKQVAKEVAKEVAKTAGPTTKHPESKDKKYYYR
jgi:hypothetical protein